MDTWRWSENYETKAYMSCQANGNLALDIGSHVGIWSKRLSKDFSQVICFEPLPIHIECHKKNCDNLNNVTLHKYALSNIETDTIMFTKPKNSGMSTIVQEYTNTRQKPNFNNQSEVIVKTKKLDSFTFPKIDFIKIDVEGHEKEVLLGGKETILKCLPKMYIEIWPKNLNYISEILKSMGYNNMKKTSSNNYLCEV